MTNAQIIGQWLKTCPNLSLVEDIETDWLQAAAESYGLYHQPSGARESYLDGSSEVTEYYFFLTRQSAQLEEERVDNTEFLQDLEDWVYLQDIEGNLPDIDGIESVKVANSFYMQESDEDEAVYQLSLEIVYMKELK